MTTIDESWEDGEDKAIDVLVLEEHKKRCREECDNFELAQDVCEYYQAEYGYFNYCFRLTYGEPLEQGEEKP